MRLAAALAACSITLVAASPALAQPGKKPPPAAAPAAKPPEPKLAEAKKLFEEGAAAYSTGNYELAIQ